MRAARRGGLLALVLVPALVPLGAFAQPEGSAAEPAAGIGPAPEEAPAPGAVRLAARGGGFAVEGPLLGYDGAFFRVDTEAGPVTVDGAAVDCTGACPAAGLARLAISGDPGAARILMPALVGAYAAGRGLAVDTVEGGLVLRSDQGAVLELRLRPNGTEEGFADLLAGEADLVLARRPVRPVEAALARDAGLGELADPLRARVLAADALVAAVADESPVGALTLPQLAAAFAGALEDWSQFDSGGEGPVGLHLLDGGTAAAQGFEDAVMMEAGLPLAEDRITRHADAEALRAALRADPGAIGILPLGALGEGLRALPLGGGCAPPLAPEPFAVGSGDYPLAMPVLVYLPAQRLPPAARDFAAWLAAPEARGAARAAGFGPEAPPPMPFAAQAERLAAGIAAVEAEGLADLKDAAAALPGYRRRVETFRFEEGSARLDAAGETEARRLAASIASGAEDGARLLFVGFSDAPGAADARLSRLRAGLVRDHVSDLAGGPGGAGLRAAGFGAALPVACGDTVWGRRANRRVELWERAD